MALTLGEVSHSLAREMPHRLAAVCGSARLSFSELDGRVDRLAAALAELGIGIGDRVLWLGQNCHRVLESFLACARLGAYFCPVNWRQSRSELCFVLEDLAPKAVIWQDEELGELATQVQVDSESEKGEPAMWICHDRPGAGSYEDLISGVASPKIDMEVVDPAAPVLFLYTAAFGGRPSAAMLTHHGLLAHAHAMAAIKQVTSSDTYLNCGPMFHVGTLMMTIPTFLYGGCNVFTRRVEPTEVCRLISQERCTGAQLLGPTVEQIVQLRSIGQYDLTSLRTFDGPPQWRAMTSPDTSPWGSYPRGYGQTEVCGLATFSAMGAPSIGTHGRASPVAEVQVVDENGHELEIGEVGELVVRGPIVMAGYWNRSEMNTSRRFGDWHRTNDLGRREADGSVSFVGPRGRLIKTGAENVYPIEVEICIEDHPEVREAAVIGVPDPVWTQSLVAVVVRAPGAKVTDEDIIAHCRRSIASYKKPRLVHFVDELPRQANLKDYAALDAQFGGGGYPGVGS